MLTCREAVPVVGVVSVVAVLVVVLADAIDVYNIVDMVDADYDPISIQGVGINECCTIISSWIRRTLI